MVERFGMTGASIRSIGRLVVTLFAAFAPWIALSAHAVTLTIAAPSDSQLPALQAQVKRWESHTGNQVRIVTLSNNAGDLFVEYRTWLASHDNSIDVYKFDSEWVGQLRHDLVDLHAAVGYRPKSFNAVLGAYQDNAGGIYGVPYTLGMPLLFYREDLLKKYHYPVPRTWDELQKTATAIQQQERQSGDSSLWGYVFEGANYEGLTASAMEWIASNGGGHLIEDNGAISVDNPRAAQAIQRAAGWIGHIAPPGEVNYRENDARGIFQTGHAVFMRNWASVWGLVAHGNESAVKGKVGVARLPAGDSGNSASVMGGWGFVVSRYSHQKADAIRLALFLGSDEAQRISAHYSLPPVDPALYHDPAMIREMPLLPLLDTIAPTLLARPSSQIGNDYPQVSYEFANAVHNVLQGQQSAAASLNALKQRLLRIRGRGW